jgi:hypothetical protein
VEGAGEGGDSSGECAEWEIAVNGLGERIERIGDSSTLLGMTVQYGCSEWRMVMEVEDAVYGC